MRAAFVAAFAALAIVPGALSASPAAPSSWSICMHDNDCMTDASIKQGTVVCNQFDSATSSDGKNTYNWGYCTQCMKDCDCDLNEVCTPSLAVNTPWWTSAQFKTLSMQDQQGRTDMLASYVHGSRNLMSTCTAIKQIDTGSAKMEGKPCSPQAPSKPDSRKDHSSKLAFCGGIRDSQPEYFTCVGKQCPSDPKDPGLKNTNAGLPGACGAYVNGTFNQPVGCDSGLAWVGRCYQKQCRYCVDGGSNCNSDQICLDGTWKKSIYVDLTRFTANRYIFSQLSTAQLAIVMIWAIGTVVACVRR